MYQTGLKTFKGGEQIVLKPLLTDLNNSFTYEFWVKPLAEQKVNEVPLTGVSGKYGRNFIVAPGHVQSDNQAGIGISIDRNGVSVYERTASNLTATLVHQVLINDWTHISLVYNEKTPFLFINGNLIKKGLTSTKDIVYPSGIFGGFADGYYKGDICNLRVWSYSRIEKEIKATMNGSIGGNEYGLYINENYEIKDNSSDVLFMFGHYRQDLEYLLFPVANSLVNKGLSVSMLIHNEHSLNLSILSSKVNLIYYDEFINKYYISLRANEYYSELINKTPTMNSKTAQYYKNYVSFSRSYTLTLLNLLRPKCIYSIHFLTCPGCIHAIKSLRFPPIVALIQHGIKRSVATSHEYHGADIVFLWGDWDKRILNRTDNAPPSVVLGSPKIEQIREDIKEKNEILSKETVKGDSRLKILYIFTNDHRILHVIKENFELFIEGISQMQNAEVIYKLHPSQPIKYLQNYFLKGVIRQEQVISGVSVNFLDLIEQANIIVGDYSTSIYEAAAINKPVLQICHSDVEDTFLKLNNVKTSQELITVINKLQVDQKYFNEFMENQNKCLEDAFNKIDGSSERIAEYIHNLTNKNDILP